MEWFPNPGKQTGGHKDLLLLGTMGGKHGGMAIQLKYSLRKNAKYKTRFPAALQGRLGCSESLLFIILITLRRRKLY